jgi:large subunit ribosomal protein L10
MNKQEKTKFIDELKTNFAKANAVVFADYKGVTSEQMNSLRRVTRDKNVQILVAKNNLVRAALKGTTKEAAVEKLAGPTVAAFAYGDAVEMAKGLSEFAKKVEAFTLKDGFLGDKSIGPAEIKHLATLPSKEVLLSQLLSVLNGPIRNFVCVLNAVQRDFVYVLKAVEDKKSQGN